jgi:hypothetical protein
MTTSLVEKTLITGAPKWATIDAFWYAGDPHAGGNALSLAHSPVRRRNSIYCWRITKFARGNFFHWRIILCARVTLLCAGEYLMRQG